nr:outer membrane beta-barrel protein [Nitrobacter winogradskyi]
MIAITQVVVDGAFTMRRLLLAAVICGAAHGAYAADMPDDFPFLRGSQPPSLSTVRTVWQGFYIGGQASYGSADMDFKNSGKDLLERLLNHVDVESQFNLSSWPLGGTSSNRNSGFGGFLGYNLQMEDVVFGVEANYTHSKFLGASSGSQGRSFSYPADYRTSAFVQSNASMQIMDFGSLRVRAGYSLGSFLPYAFGGVAMGQANIRRNASYNLHYQYVGTQIPPLPNLAGGGSLSDNANAHFIYGYAAGLGIDMMIVDGLFLRAEWEFLRFTAPVDTIVNTVRAGAGYRF